MSYARVKRFGCNVILLVSIFMIEACGSPAHINVITPSPIAVGAGQVSKTIHFRGVKNDIASNVEVGEKRYRDPMRNRPLKLSTMGGAHFTKVAYDTLKKYHYNVVGDPNNLFEDKNVSAEMLLGARVKDIYIDVFYETFGIDYTFGKVAVSLELEWQLYNGLEQKTVLTLTTKGAANGSFEHNNLNGMMHPAFENAMLHLFADKKFHDAVTGDAYAASGASSTQAPLPNLAQYSVAYASAQDTRKMAEVQKSVVTIIIAGGHGSGFMVCPGLIVTNNHVVGDAPRVRIITYDGRQFDVNVLAKDVRRDVAVLGAVGIDLPPLKVRKSPVVVGEDIYAIGSPKDINLAGTVTKGIVSSFRQMHGGSWIQGDAAINPGSSGGPLVDAKGNLLGISTLSRKESQGIFFYVPISDALARLGIGGRF